MRDIGLLESALAQVQSIFSYEPDADTFRLAAAYCTGFVKNHPFIDGNKRTGILSAVAFLSLNGVVLDFEEATIVVMVAGLAAGEISEDQLAAWFREACL